MLKYKQDRSVQSGKKVGIREHLLDWGVEGEMWVDIRGSCIVAAGVMTLYSPSAASSLILRNVGVWSVSCVVLLQYCPTTTGLVMLLLHTVCTASIHATVSILYTVQVHI